MQKGKRKKGKQQEKQSRLFILTVHWNCQHWLPIQNRYIKKHTLGDYVIRGNYTGQLEFDIKDYPGFMITKEKDHAKKLNTLSKIVSIESRDPEDIIVFLDGDAFPIMRGWDIEIRKLLKVHDMVAIRRDDNQGDKQPHPSFCATTVGFWETTRMDWSTGGYTWINDRGDAVTDVGAKVLEDMEFFKAAWLPMIRTNRINLHPVFFGIYGDMIYHHGAGFRPKLCRHDCDRQERFNKALVFARNLNQKASRWMVEQIQADMKFHRLLI